MDTSSFFYDLPKQLIAQTPAVPRDHSRLLCLNRADGGIADTSFYHIADYLNPGDLLVVNNSKVIPARLTGEKEGFNIPVETLLLRDLGDDRWETIVKPGRRLKEGARIVYREQLSGEVTGVLENGNRIIRFSYPQEESFFHLIDRIGEMPLPHYITAPLQNRDDYQTVYAKHPGSAAAPTAGFHLTEPLLGQLRGRGVFTAEITLHVGLGTFRPVKEQQIEDHYMHTEYYSVPKMAAEQIRKTRQSGNRVVAVGTTSCRTLEACAARYGEVIPCENQPTDIFIYPGYRFRAIDALITNFHLPESTLIMLVSAFAGYEHTMNAYRHAVRSRYRFYSFGDAMLVI